MPFAKARRKSLQHKHLRQIFARRFALSPYAVRIYAGYSHFRQPTGLGGTTPIIGGETPLRSSTPQLGYHSRSW